MGIAKSKSINLSYPLTAAELEALHQAYAVDSRCAPFSHEEAKLAVLGFIAMTPGCVSITTVGRLRVEIEQKQQNVRPR